MKIKEIMTGLFFSSCRKTRNSMHKGSNKSKTKKNKEEKDLLAYITEQSRSRFIFTQRLIPDSNITKILSLPLLPLVYLIFRLCMTDSEKLQGSSSINLNKLYHQPQRRKVRYVSHQNPIEVYTDLTSLGHMPYFRVVYSKWLS